MDLYTTALVIRLIAQIIIWVVIASALLSFFLSPYHPVREALNRITEPMLAPIRRVMPAAGMFDFSPLVLIILIEVVSRILVGILLTL